MKPHILVEGATDEAILRAILPEIGNQARFWQSHGRSSVLSLARSLISSQLGPVAVVFDSDSTEEAIIAQRTKDARTLLGVAGDEGEDWELIVFVPEIEELLLQDPRSLSSLKDLAKTPRIAAAQKKSREDFRSLLGKRRLGQWLPTVDLRHLRDRPPVNTLVKFLVKHGSKIDRVPKARSR